MNKPQNPPEMPLQIDLDKPDSAWKEDLALILVLSAVAVAILCIGFFLG